MKPLYWIVLGVIVLSLATYVGWDRLTGSKPRPSALAGKALSAGDGAERVRAATALTMSPNKAEALPELRRVAKETSDPNVLAVALHGLASFADWTESTSLFIADLDHPDKIVRSAAYQELLVRYAGALPEGISYKVDDPAAERAQVVRQLMEYHSRPQPRV